MGTIKKDSKDNCLQALKFKIAFFTIGILGYIGLLIMAIIQKLNIFKN
jgi:preprotein translocase subunit Sss1